MKLHGIFGEIERSGDDLVGNAIAQMGKNLALALPGRSTGRVSPTDAIRWFLSAEINRHDLDEVIILDELDAQKQMAPVVETERHRMRTARESKG